MRRVFVEGSDELFESDSGGSRAISKLETFGAVLGKMTSRLRRYDFFRARHFYSYEYFARREYSKRLGATPSPFYFRVLCAAKFPGPNATLELQLT